ncbi:MAG: WD40/YVTN/BNR-like repeat-containing protein, partial [Anaerolineae bacterium]
VMYTVGGVALLGFILFLRALFMTQSQPTAGDSPIPTPPPPPTMYPQTPAPDFTPTVAPPYWLGLPIEVSGGAQLAVSGQHIWVTDRIGGGLHSADGGATWSAITLPSGTRWIAAAPDIEYEIERGLFAAAADGVHRSIDAGTTWQPILTSPGSEFTSVDVSMDGTIFVSERESCAVRRATDDGSTWTKFQVTPDGCTLARVLVWPLSHDGRQLYALGADYGLWRSVDRGATWTMISPGYHADLAFDPVNASQFYTVDGNSVSWFWEEYNLWRDPVP